MAGSVFQAATYGWGKPRFEELGYGFTRTSGWTCRRLLRRVLRST